MYYLAYGMNTNLAGMAHRCPRAFSMGKVLLLDHSLKFKYHADAEYSPGDSMECAIWRITEECEFALDMLEAYPDYYNKKTVSVMFNNKPVDAMIYYMNTGNELGTPTQNYFNSVLQGYYQHGMDTVAVHRAYDETLELDVVDLSRY